MSDARRHGPCVDTPRLRPSGPKATLVLYEDENYGDKRREVKAGERVSDLHRSIFSEGVESLQLLCTGK
jgi:hypothetical protein